MPLKIGLDYLASDSIILNGKTYVLKREGKPVLIKGNTLRSRRYEPFIRQYILSCIDFIFDGRYDLCRAEYESLQFLIANSLISIDDIKQKQTLNSTITEYE